MKIHAVQTGSVRIKRAQTIARGHGTRRQLAIFFDREWTDWLPTFAWVIDHPEGVIVVDTGQGSHLLDHAKLLHPYLRWEVAFRIEREQEIGPQLRAMGIGPRDVHRPSTCRPTTRSPRPDSPSVVRSRYPRHLADLRKWQAGPALGYVSGRADSRSLSTPRGTRKYTTIVT